MNPADPPLRGATLATLAAIVVVGAGAGLAAAARVGDADLRRILWAGSVTLVFGALLGGVVQQLFTDFNRRRLARAAQAQFVANVLDDLKAVYDRVERARTLIAAHHSALTYGNEMRDLIEARVKLLDVLRSLVMDPRREALAGVRAGVARMEAYLAGVVDEFRREYKAIADAQKLREARVAARPKAFERDPAAVPELPGNEPWQRLSALPELTRLLAGGVAHAEAGDSYRAQFVAPLDDASQALREALRRVQG